MANIKIVMADLDEKYLMPLERKFIDEFGDSAEINVITDEAYLQEFFSEPRSLETLIINENLYNRSLERHDINNVYILSEQMPEESTTEALSIDRIYKYTSVKEIYSKVANSSSVKSVMTSKNTKETITIMVYSPIGGIGKTTMAAGLSAAIAKNYKKVLYLSTDNIQAFGHLFSSDSYLPANVERQFFQSNEQIYQGIKGYIQTEVFDYIPPFRMALSSLNITMNEYIHMIQSVKETNEYDYIIVDTVSDFFGGISKLMSVADKVLVVTGQDDYSVYKLERLLNNIDTSDKNKFCFVCNKYDSDSTNFLVSNKYENVCRVNEYIDFDQKIQDANIEQLSEISGIQKIAFLYI